MRLIQSELPHWCAEASLKEFYCGQLMCILYSIAHVWKWVGHMVSEEAECLQWILGY